MDNNDIPSNLGISEAMKEAYVRLGKNTPFSKWASARLWDAIDKESKEVEGNGSDNL